MCANSQAIGVLKHSLRSAQEAKKLKKIKPEPSRLHKFNRYSSSVLNLAACVTVLFLTKIGVFSSMNTFQTQGQKVIQKYYANRIGNDLADEIFPEDINVANIG